MGASISKSKSSKSSFMSFCDKATKKSSLGPGSVRVEPCLYAQLKKQGKKKKKQRQSHKKNVTKSIIGKPTDFIHLNHAGIDYTSMETLFMPIEQAQMIHIAASNSNYAVDHSFPSARHQIERNHQQRIQLSMTPSSQRQAKEYLSEYNNGAGSRPGPFSDELYNMLHGNKIPTNSQLGLAN